MNWFNPFRLIVPASDKAHLVASRSYLSYGRAELQDKLDRNPYSYLHVIHPAGSKTATAKRGSEAYYHLVRNRYEDFLKAGWLRALNGQRLAIYRQTTDSHTCTGLVGTLAVDGIRAGRLKLHEQTLEKRERIFAKYLGVVGCHAEPILCMYPDQRGAGASARARIQAWSETHAPDFDFSTTDRIRHSVWILDVSSSLELSNAFEPIESLYLADGHHRVASSLRVAEKHPDTESKQHVLAFAVPESELIVKGYHREIILPDWGPDEWETAFKRCSDQWTWARCDAHEQAPAVPGTMNVHHSGMQWSLTWKDSAMNEVDAERLQRVFFEPILGIHDARTDARIGYLPGTWSTAELQRQVKEQADRAIFELHPVLTNHIKRTADAGGFLPPKSTWIEPKLRSGLFIHEIT